MSDWWSGLLGLWGILVAEFELRDWAIIILAFSMVLLAVAVMWIGERR